MISINLRETHEGSGRIVCFDVSTSADKLDNTRRFYDTSILSDKKYVGANVAKDFVKYYNFNI